MKKLYTLIAAAAITAPLSAQTLNQAPQLPPIDAGAILAQIQQQNNNIPQPIISPDMQFALEAASSLRQDLKKQGVKAKVGLLNEPGGRYGLWVEFKNWADYEKVKDLFYQDPGHNPGYMDLKVYPRVPKSGAGEQKAADLQQLRKAVAASSIPEMSDYNRAFWLKDYPASATIEKMLLDATDWEADNIIGAFKMASGDRAVRQQAAEWRSEADEQTSNDDAKSARVYRDVAAALEPSFIGNRAFASVTVASHSIAEDGDTEYRFILAKRTDGRWLMLGYYNFPF